MRGLAFGSVTGYGTADPGTWIVHVSGASGMATQSVTLSVAVEVGFEPTEGLPLHTLSRTVRHRSPPAVSVCDKGGQAASDRR